MKKATFLNSYSNYFYKDEIDLISNLIDILEINNIIFDDNYFIHFISDIINRFRKEKSNPYNLYNKYEKFNTFKIAGWYMANIYNELANTLDEKLSAEIVIDLAYKIIEEPFIYPDSNTDEIEWLDKVDIKESLKDDEIIEKIKIQNMVALLNKNTNYSFYADNLYLLYFHAYKEHRINKALKRGCQEQRKMIILTRKNND